MKTVSWNVYVFWILLTEAVGAFAGWLTADANRLFSETAMQPPLAPPGWVFPIVWTILYALMGISIARVRLTPPSRVRNQSTNLFIAQLILNFFWTLIFFNLQAYGLAFLWLLLLWVLVLGMILAFGKAEPLAAKLQIPYLIWLTFAAYLNLGVWYLNR